MNIVNSSQPSDPPADKPLVKNPVKAKLDVQVYFIGEHGPVLQLGGIFCGKGFAETVLATIEKHCKDKNFAMAHVGFYNPRKARKKDGTLIKPERWSNHAYGEAFDFKGVITQNGAGRYYDINALKKTNAKFLNDLVEACRSAIIAKGRKPEIVDEGGWIHVGIYQ